MNRQYFTLCRFLIIFLITICATSSCNSIDKKSTALKHEYEQPITTDLKKIAFPQGLEYYAPFDQYLMDSTQLKETKSVKIYSYVNASCPSCIVEISLWGKYARQFMNQKTPVILVLYSHDNFEYIKHLCEVGDIPSFPFPFVLDTKNQFGKLNTCFTASETNPSVLVDTDSKVVLTGNPLHAKKVSDAYFKKIKEMQSLH